jgi:hypothetical protein
MVVSTTAPAPLTVIVLDIPGAILFVQSRPLLDHARSISSAGSHPPLARVPQSTCGLARFVLSFRLVSRSI